jgi:hypothetical protein
VSLRARAKNLFRTPQVQPPHNSGAHMGTRPSGPGVETAVRGATRGETASRSESARGAVHRTMARTAQAQENLEQPPVVPSSDANNNADKSRLNRLTGLLKRNNPLRVTLHNPFTQTVRNTGTTAPSQARQTVEQREEKIQRQRVSTKPLGRVQSAVIDKITRNQVEFVAPRTYPGRPKNPHEPYEPDLHAHQIQTCFLSALEQRVHFGDIEALNDVLIEFAKTMQGTPHAQFYGSLHLIHGLLTKHRGDADAALKELQGQLDAHRSQDHGEALEPPTHTNDFIQTLQKRFEGGDIATLNKELLAFTDTLPGSAAQNQEMGVRLATILRAAADRNADHALLMLRALRASPSERSASTELDANKLRHALAQTGSGMTILLHLEDKNHLTDLQKQAYRHSLDICRRLTMEQVLPSFHADGKPWSGSIEDFVGLAKTHAKINDFILQDDDHPTQLLNKALLFAVEKMEHGKFEAIPQSTREAHFGAYNAYSQGFYTSVKDSPLALYALHTTKWHKHIKRAGEGGPATPANLAKDAKNGVRKLLTGKGQEPIRPLVEQAQTILGTDQEEGAKFRAQLHSVIDTLRLAMQINIDKRRANPKHYQDGQIEQTILEIRMVLLETMREKSIKSFRLDKAEVLEKLAAKGVTPDTNPDLDICIDYELSLHPAHHVGIDAQPSTRGLYALHAKTNKLTDKLVGKKWLPEARRMRFKLLEQYAQDLFKPPPELANGMRVQFEECIAKLERIPLRERTRAQRKELEYARLMMGISQARQLGNGGMLQRKDRIDKFQWRDLAVLAARQRPRERLNEAVIHDTLSKVGTKLGKFNTTVTYATATRARGLNIKDVDIGIPGFLTFRPMLVANRSRKTSIQAGNAPAGVEFVIGKSRAWNVGVGLRVTAGWNNPGKQTGAYATGGFEMSGTFRNKGTHAVLSSALDNKGGGYQTDKNKDHLDYVPEIAGFIKNISYGETAPSLAEAWQRLSMRHGDDQRFNAALRHSNEYSVTSSLNLGAGARGGVKEVRFGPFFSLDVMPNFEHTELTNNGRFQNRTINEQIGVRARLTGSLVAKGQALGQIDQYQLGLAGLPIVAVGSDFDLVNFRRMIRVGSDENGVRAGQTFGTVYCQNSTDFIRHLNSREANHEVPNWADDYKMDAHDGTPLQGIAVAEQIKLEVEAETKTGNKKFEERVQLKEAAAVAINSMSDEVKDLLSTGPYSASHIPDKKSVEAQEIKALEQKVIDIYGYDGRWIDRWLKCTQMEFQAKTQFIPLLPISVSSQEQAETWHARIDARGTEARIKKAVPYTGTGPEYQRELDELTKQRSLTDGLSHFGSDVTFSDGENNGSNIVESNPLLAT